MAAQEQLTLAEFHAAGLSVARSGRVVGTLPKRAPEPAPAANANRGPAAKAANGNRRQRRSLAERLAAILDFGRLTLKLDPEEALQIEMVRHLRAWTLQGRLLATWTATCHELRIPPRALGALDWLLPTLVVKRANMGCLKGSPDLVFHWRGGGAEFEIKVPSQPGLLPVGGELRVREAQRGELSDAQRTRRDWCLSLGVPYETVRSVAALEAELTRLGVLLVPLQNGDPGVG